MRTTGWKARAALVVAALIVTSACGTRRDVADIQTAARAGLALSNGSVSSTGAPVTTNDGVTTPGIPGATTTQPGTAILRPAPGGGSTLPGGASGPAAEANLSPIKIGAVGTISGIGGTQLGSVNAVQAWAKAKNDAGGFGGHPVQLYVVDDGADPARHRAAMQELVQTQHVVAFVGNLSAFSESEAAVKFIEEQRVPVIGGDRLSKLWTTSPMMFPQAAAGDALIWVHLANTLRLAGRGATVGWLTCQEAQICRDADRLWQLWAPKLGLNVAYHDQVSVAQPNFTAQCIRAKEAHVKFMLLGTDANSIRRVGASCAQQDFHPRYAVLQTSDAMTAEPGLDGGYFGSSTFPWVSQDTAATREFHEVMAKEAPDVELSAHATSGWVAAKLFEKVLTAIGPPFTSPRILEGLWTIHDDNIDGLSSSITFRRNASALVPYCYFPMELRSRHWIVTDGGRLFCSKPPE